MRGHGVAMDKANACKVDSVDVLVQDLDIVFKACLDQFDSSARFLVAGRTYRPTWLYLHSLGVILSISL